MSQLSSASAAKETAGGFLLGGLCLIRGFRFVYVEHRELARFYLPPMILAVAFLLGGLFVFSEYVDQVVAWMWSEPGPEIWWGVAHFVWRAVAILLWIAFALLTAVLTVVLFAIFAAPMSDLISERVEGLLQTWEPRPFSVKFMLSDLGYTIQLEVVRALIKLAWLAPLFIGSLFFPVVGQAVYLILGGYLMSKFTGMDYIDWCAARRGWTWKERLAFAKHHRSALVGFGSGVLVSLMIPMFFVFVWPAAVAGGTILFTTLVNNSQSAIVPAVKE